VHLVYARSVEPHGCVDAAGEIKKMDPDFRIDEFLKEMEEYMIPVVVEAFLKPDMDLIRAVCAGEVRGVYRTVLPVCV